MIPFGERAGYLPPRTGVLVIRTGQFICTSERRSTLEEWDEEDLSNI